MKILVAHNFYRSQLVGGEDIVVREEVKFLKSVLGDNNVLTYFVGNDALKSIHLIKNIWGDKHHAQNIKNIIIENKINILHVHNEFPLLTPLIFKYAAQAGCKVIQTLHNFRKQCLSGILFKQNSICEQCVHKNFKLPGIISKCYRNGTMQSTVHALAQYWYSLQKFEQCINAYFVLTQFQKNKLLSFGIPEQKLRLKPNFIAPIHQSSIDIVQREQYLFIGRIESAKGIDFLLSTWVRLPNKFKLTIIGDGPDLKKLQNQYNQNNITFKGRCDASTIGAELNNSRYLLHTSLCYETFGLTILEAMQHSVPVIGFDIGTRGEFIQDGINGFLANKSNIASVILQSDNISNYADMVQKAKETAQKYAQEKLGALQLKIYEQIIKNN